MQVSELVLDHTQLHFMHLPLRLDVGAHAVVKSAMTFGLQLVPKRTADGLTKRFLLELRLFDGHPFPHFLVQ